MQPMRFVPATARHRKLLIEIISYAFILLFLYAAFYKLLDIPLFKRELAKSPLLGSHKNFLAWTIPILELAIASMLFTSKLRSNGLLAATLLMGSFTVYIAYLLAFAPWVPCSCGGIFATMDWKDHLLFNAVFVLLGSWGYCLQRYQQWHS